MATTEHRQDNKNQIDINNLMNDLNRHAEAAKSRFDSECIRSNTPDTTRTKGTKDYNRVAGSLNKSRSTS